MAVSRVANNRADQDVSAFRKALLKWYGRHHRPMPWRAPPGGRPDPYHEWLSEIMLQQTTVVTVRPYFEKFIKKWPTVKALAQAPQDEVLKEWAGLGYYARARNLHKCATVVANDYKGRFPQEIDELETLPGIGEYTANAIAAIAFDKPACVVDGNVERVVSRLFLITTPLPEGKKPIKEKMRALTDGRTDSPGDFAQGMMELGATICTPRSPKCGLCPVESFCAAREKGVQETLPARAAKKAKPKKYGYVYWVERKTDGAVLFERRDEKGMLGGMSGLPTSVWTPDLTEKDHIPGLTPAETAEKARVLHSFTHFDLELRLVRARLKNDRIPGDNRFWIASQDMEGLGLPTLFRKAVKIMT